MIKEWKVKEMSLAEQGRQSIDWAEKNMPVLLRIRHRFLKDKPLSGLRISACLHVTKETGVLAKTLLTGGADVMLVASNPLSTQDRVAAALVEEGVNVFAWRNQTPDDYWWAIDKAVNYNPHITMDDGGDLTTRLHESSGGSISEIIGGTEETTTGVLRLKSMEKSGALAYPIIAVNNAETKWDFDNIYGTGQSTIDGIIRATNVLLAGKTVVVAGYGHCGRGIANRARGMGARTIVTEVNPIRALKALMDGFQVMPMDEASGTGDIFITATGVKDVINKSNFTKMKNGTILANSGHFNVEINVSELEEISVSKRIAIPNVEEYCLKDGTKINLLAQGRLVNLVCAEGHPSEVMDMSFSNQALSVEYLVENRGDLKPIVYDVPKGIDLDVARMKLSSINVTIDVLNKQQEDYLEKNRFGT
jgi:adenosylhomocysteinase